MIERAIDIPSGASAELTSTGTGAFLFLFFGFLVFPQLCISSAFSYINQKLDFMRFVLGFILMLSKGLSCSTWR